MLNERGNVAPLVERLRAVLAGVAWEAIFVDDDSADGTRDVVAAIGRQDARVRLLHRIGRRGLSSAFIEGAQASLAPFVAAMDGDLQHDEALLPRMLAALRDDGYEVAVGSRYIAGGGVGAWDRRRAGMSDLATRLSRLILRAPVSDPMSGFFMLRRTTLDAAVRGLSAMGFKILLDLLASLPAPPKLIELPYEFRNRVAGESKLDAGVLRDYLLLLIDKLVGHVVPVRFVLFAAVGVFGIAAHLVMLRVALPLVGFEQAQTFATAVAIVANYTLNNLFTFRDRRLTRPAAVDRPGHVLGDLQRRRRRQCRRRRIPVRPAPRLLVVRRRRRRADEPGLELCGELGDYLAAMKRRGEAGQAGKRRAAEGW